MAIKLSRRSFEHAKRLIGDGKAVVDGRDDWSEHQPSARQENEFIEGHGWDEYGKWHLAVDDDQKKETKGH